MYSMMVDPGEEDEAGTIGYGDLVVTGSLDCTARSWDFVSGNCLRVCLFRPCSETLCSLTTTIFQNHTDITSRVSEGVFFPISYVVTSFICH